MAVWICHLRGCHFNVFRVISIFSPKDAQGAVTSTVKRGPDGRCSAEHFPVHFWILRRAILSSWVIRLPPQVWSMAIVLSIRIVWFPPKVWRIRLILSTWIIRLSQSVYVRIDSRTRRFWIPSGAWLVGFGAGAGRGSVSLSSRVVWFSQGAQIIWICSGACIISTAPGTCESRIALRGRVVWLSGWA